MAKTPVTVELETDPKRGLQRLIFTDDKGNEFTLGETLTPKGPVNRVTLKANDPDWKP